MNSRYSLPDRDKCKTKPIYDDLWFCVTIGASRCPYVIGVGSEYYCDHRERRNFVTIDQSGEKSNYGL